MGRHMEACGLPLQASMCLLQQCMSSTPGASLKPASPNAPDVARWKLLLLPLLLVAARVALARMIELSGDEAYYWTWSRNLAGGYFDHPPMVAWLIRLSVGIFGTNELGVRMPAILLAAGSMLLAGDIARLCGATNYTILRLQAALFCLPLLQLQAALMTPDTPALFFTLAAIAWALRFLLDPSNPWHWLMFGTLCGLAMLSKYTTVLPIGAIFIFLLIARARYAWRILSAGALAILVTWPMLMWNYRHDWISFRFQLQHGVGPDEKPWYLTVPDYLGGQLLAATPVLAGLMLWAALRTLRRGTDARTRLLAVTGGVTLCFFAFTAFRHKVEVNWPALAWPILLILLELHVQRLDARLSTALRAGVIVAALFTAALHLPPAFLARVAPRSPIAGIGGWKQLARKIHSVIGDLPVFCTRYQDAGLMAFYMPGRPFIRILHRPQNRWTQFDLPPYPQLPEGEFIIISDGSLPPGANDLAIDGRIYPIDVVKSQHYRTDLDGFQARGRIVIWARSRER